MNTKSVAIVAVASVAAMPIATSLVRTNAVFAGGYEKNQATSQANDCGNGKLPLYVGCQNVGSHIHGDENSVAIAADQAFDD